MINFHISIKPQNLSESDKLADVAKILNTFPDTKATLVGNTGSDRPDGSPTGGGSKVINESGNVLNNKPATMGQIMRARANAAKKMLHDVYNIPNNRMQTSTGTHQHTPSNRTVDVIVSGINL